MKMKMEDDRDMQNARLRILPYSPDTNQPRAIVHHSTTAMGWMEAFLLCSAFS